MPAIACISGVLASSLTTASISFDALTSASVSEIAETNF
jgi:hypothetical protein